MNSTQKIIKYLAIALAVFIIINIASAIFYGLYSLSGVLGLTNHKESTNMEIISHNYEEGASILYINIKSAKLKIKTGDTLKAETNNKYITCQQDGNQLSIEEKSHSWFSKENNSELTIYIPSNMTLKEVNIATGAGKVDIEKLTAENLQFQIGAGKVKINQLNVSKQTDIEGGAGKIEILNGTIHNLDLDMGVGAMKLTSTMTGTSRINAGIGSLTIQLRGNKEDYQIKSSKGIGSINIDGKNQADDSTYGDGDNIVELDGGIGSIDVTFR